MESTSQNSISFTGQDFVISSDYYKRLFRYLTLRMSSDVQ